MKVIFTILTIGFCFSSVSKAQTADSSQKQGTFVLTDDNPIVAMMDSLNLVLHENKIIFSTEKSDSDHSFRYDDSIIALRMQKLNHLSPIELVYNYEVKQFVDLYLGKRKALTERMLGLSELYFPIFEEYLDKYNLPYEFKYLPIVESALNPTARSRVGASGLWQFMLFTGKQYDLEVNSFVDERFDPVQSTIAACEHLSDLYDIFKDWSLVLAAYNSGAGNVTKAIRRSGGEMDFWKIMDYLPRETQGYVPAFIAVNYVMNYHAEHNISVQEAPISFREIDSVMIHKNLAFSQVAEYIKVPRNTIDFLNPMYRLGFIPASEENNPFYLYLPKEHIGNFINNEASIYAYKSKELQEKEKLLTDAKTKYGDYKKAGYTYYTVRSGDVLGKIAQMHGCSITDLQRWNNLYNTNIYPGQKLYVRGSASNSQNKNTGSQVASNNQSQSQVSSSRSFNRYVYYTVKEGDTLWDIAQRYQGISVDDIKNINNLDGNNLQPGQKLKIGVN